MRIYELEREILIPAPLEKVWDYFSSPENLNNITPPDMSFEILTDLSGKKMYAGMIILYRLKPMLNIPLRWTTEITHCSEKSFFVDEQRSGPFAFWHHQHHFREEQNGVLMTDILHYALPMGWPGQLAEPLFVRKRLEKIFDYRSARIRELFG